VPVTVLSTGTFNSGLPWPGDPSQGYIPVGFQYAPGYPGGPSDNAGAALTDGSAITITSNTSYSFYKNLALGQIGSPSVPVHNVTFTGCCWEDTGTNAPNVIMATDGAAAFSYCTIRPAGLTDHNAPVAQAAGYQYGILADGTKAAPGTFNSFQGGPLTFSYCDIWGFANASKCQLSTQANFLTYDHCWAHNARLNTSGSDHTDGFGGEAGGTASYVTISACRVESIGDTQALAFQNFPDAGHWDNFRITNNMFGGFGNTICIVGGTNPSDAAPTNITFTGNTFSTLLQCQVTPLYSALMAPSAGGNLWRGNKWHVPPGAFWGNPAHDGWYWMPVGSNIAGTDDTPFVSLTDYTG
jgi:hypothetical protein